MYYVYILTTDSNKLLYIGITSDIRRRMIEHKFEQIEGYTKRYHIHKLVYVEEFSDVDAAIAREKQLKKWTRAKKDRLIETENPNWDDWIAGYI